MAFQRITPTRLAQAASTTSFLAIYTAQGTALTPEVQVTVGVRNFPGAANSTSDATGNTLTRDVVTTASIDQYTNQVYVRARGRQMNFKIASEDVGVQWQLGTTRVDFRPDGRRG